MQRYFQNHEVVGICLVIHKNCYKSVLNFIFKGQIKLKMADDWAAAVNDQESSTLSEKVSEQFDER